MFRPTPRWRSTAILGRWRRDCGRGYPIFPTTSGTVFLVSRLRGDRQAVTHLAESPPFWPRLLAAGDDAAGRDRRDALGRVSVELPASPGELRLVLRHANDVFGTETARRDRPSVPGGARTGSSHASSLMTSARRRRSRQRFFEVGTALSAGRQLLRESARASPWEPADRTNGKGDGAHPGVCGVRPSAEEPLWRRSQARYRWRSALAHWPS